MGESPDPTVRFGVFQLDLRTGELWKGGVRIRLPEQPFQVLKALLECPGELVTRDELRQKLWPSDTFVDFEHGLNAAVRRLRDVLGDSADVPRFVETMPRRGYRFIAPTAAAVTTPPPAATSPSTAASASATSSAETAPVESFPVPPAAGPRRRDSRRLSPIHIAGLAVVVLIALVVAAFFFAGGHAVDEPLAVAVMPVRNMTGEVDQDVFTDAMTAELINQLNLIAPARLRVTGLQSSLHYKNTQKRTDEIGRELDVGHLLETSLTRTGEQTRIIASLVDVRTQVQLWSPDPYQEDSNRVETLQRRAVDDIVRQVATALGVPPAPREVGVARHSLNDAASDAYRKGRHHLTLGTRDGLESALGFFSKAIELDPSYALAYTGLADTYMLLASDGFLPLDEAYPLARKNATVALEKDSTLAEAHTSLGAVLADYYRDWTQAGWHFQKAVDLAPNYQQGHAYYAFFLACMKEFDRSISEAQQAKMLEPVSPAAWMNMGTTYYFKRDYRRALESFDGVLEIDPEYVHALVMKGRTYAAQGRHDDAVKAIEHARTIHPNRPDVTTSYAYVLARAQRHDEARRVVEELRRISPAGPSPFRLAYVHLALDEKDRALRLLDQAVDARDWQMQMLLVEPAFDGVRSDPRFTRLLTRIGLSR